MITTRPRLDDKTFVVIAVVGCMAAYALLFAFITAGVVRHVSIFLPEKTETP